MFSETDKTTAADKGKAAEKRGRTDGPNTRREPTPVPHEELGTSGLQKKIKSTCNSAGALCFGLTK